MAAYDPVDSPDATTVFEYHDLTPPTVHDVYAAGRVIDSELPRTPLVRSEPLSEELNAEVYLKREDTLPTGAFKVRGGLNLVAELPAEFRDPGLIAASTGNHGQSVAYAGREMGVPVTVAVPADANPDKVAAMKRLGARIEAHGADFDEAREHAERLAVEEGYRYVHSANEPDLIRGVGTAGLEVLEQLPSVDYLFCPVGGGSSAAGYCLTVGAIGDATVVGAQSAAAPAVHRAYTEGHLDPHDRMETFAEGMATRVPFALTTEILRERLDEFLLVEESELRHEVARAFVEDHVVMEGACAAAPAAARRMRDEIAGSTVVLQVSGRNIPAGKLFDIVADSEFDP